MLATGIGGTLSDHATPSRAALGYVYMWQ